MIARFARERRLAVELRALVVELDLERPVEVPIQAGRVGQRLVGARRESGVDRVLVDVDAADASGDLERTPSAVERIEVVDRA